MVNNKIMKGLLMEDKLQLNKPLLNNNLISIKILIQFKKKKKMTGKIKNKLNNLKIIEKLNHQKKKVMTINNKMKIVIMKMKIDIVMIHNKKI